MSDKRIEILRDMDTAKAITKLAIPAIIGFMVMAIYNVADTMFVSWWGYKGVGAVQIVFPIMMIASAIGLAFGIGGASYISRLLGKSDKQSANSVVTSCLFVAVAIATVYISIMLLYLDPILKRFGAGGDMLGLSHEYGFYIIIGSIFVIPSMVLNNSLRAEGSAKFSMLGMLIGSVINIAIDPLFIFIFEMGIQGAAIATMLSQGISFLILLQFYSRKKTVLNISVRFFKFDIKMYGEILKIGLPTFFRQILFSISMLKLNEAAFYLGSDYLLSAMGIALKVTSMIGFFIFGMGQGIQPVVGYNFGAKNMKRVLSAQKHGMIMTFGITVISCILMIIFAQNIVMIFTDNAVVINYGTDAMVALCLALMLMAVTNNIAVVFQAIGNAKVSMMFSVLRQGVFLIPTIIIISKYFGIGEFIYAQFIADLSTFIVSMFIYIPFVKNIMKEVS